jgi:hypothetical protein
LAASSRILVPEGPGRMSHIVEQLEELYYRQSKKSVGKQRLPSSTGGRKGSA